MKKILSLVLAAVTSLSLAACSADKTAVSSPDTVVAESSTAPAESPDESSGVTVTAEAPQNTPEAGTEQSTQEAQSAVQSAESPAISEDGTYTSRDDVALYIHTYGHLPGNFITKKQARELGWNGGSVEDYAPGKCIGGDHFGNYEGLLPEKDGRSYTECDIDTLGKSGRGAKRIIFSNDGLIYYTDDHYASFTLLYGEE